MNTDFAAELQSVLQRAEELRDKAPENSEAPGVKPNLAAACTFLAGAIGAVETLAPEVKVPANGTHVSAAPTRS